MGWFLWEMHGAEAVVHPGNIESFGTFATMVPADNWGFVVLINSKSYVSGPQPSSLVRGITNLLFDQEPRPVRQANFPMSLQLLTLLLFAQATAAMRTIYLLRKWRRNEDLRPVSLWTRHIWHAVVPLFVSASIAFGLLYVLPHSFELDFRGLLQFAPDAGYLAVANSLFAIIWGLTRIILVPRCLRRTQPTATV